MEWKGGVSRSASPLPHLPSSVPRSLATGTGAVGGGPLFWACSTPHYPCLVSAQAFSSSLSSSLGPDGVWHRLPCCHRWGVLQTRLMDSSEGGLEAPTGSGGKSSPTPRLKTVLAPDTGQT